MNKMDKEIKKKIDNFLYYHGKQILYGFIAIVAIVILVVLLSKEANLNFGIVYNTIG